MDGDIPLTDSADHGQPSAAAASGGPLYELYDTLPGHAEPTTSLSFASESHLLASGGTSAFKCTYCVLQNMNRLFICFKFMQLVIRQCAYGSKQKELEALAPEVFDGIQLLSRDTVWGFQM